MKRATVYHCEVCGAPHGGQGWFLVSEDRDDTLQILNWNSRLAARPGMRHLCSVEHVEELVSHWMIEDGWSGPCPHPSDPAADSHPSAPPIDLSYRLGELMLDRSSFAALGERPEMMNSILDAIDGVLQASTDVNSLLNEEEEDSALVVYDA